jgi:Mrp family chromosome partitioning ATPase
MMATFLGEVKEKLKECFMIIDSPPCQVMSETKFLAQQVDGIVFVAMANKTPRKKIEKAVNNVGREKILGVVFNGYEQVRKSYYRYYDRYWYAAGGGTMDPVSDKGAYVEGRHICSRGS